ncbi:major facilitator superfamily domain-containing protein [Massariosphaeria phaeospora]|uniref:Major facilitator superfamily domain-containing protein n=1 Tax=Massariosphaeria phaeospora TaxID=100035 RepID=A0A7C8I2Y2_9PLEO|nr:major facilitator superfamily domain-containing protein [Massariosphaeria phaeospora]
MTTTNLSIRAGKNHENILEEIPSTSPIAQDGGAVAWLQCAGAFCLFFNSWGLVNTFGIFQAYYETSMLSNVAASKISWIGSLEAFLFVFGGVVTGPLYDRGYLLTMVRTGSVLVVLGLILTSICSKYWQLMLAQGLLTGLGSAMFFVPSMALLPTYFVKRRALSTGIAITGGNIGGIVYSVVFRQLQPRIGFGWATRTIALIMLVTLILPVTCLRMRSKPPAARRFFDPQVWTETPFVTFAVSCFFGLIGLYIPYFYIDSFARENELAGTNLALYLLPIMNAGSVVGRVTLCYIADRTGPVSILILCAIGITISVLAWPGVSSEATLITFSVIYGCFSGTYLSLVMTTVAVALCPDMSVIGLRIGMACIPCATGLLIGSPIGGVTVKHGWLGLQMLTGAVLSLSAIGLMRLRVLKVGWKLWKRC